MFCNFCTPFFVIPQFLVIYKLVTLKEFQHETAEVDLLKITGTGCLSLTVTEVIL